MPRFNPPPNVLDIAHRLEAAGHETWFVGGAVRDALLGHAHLDWDLATAATPPEVEAVFGRRRTIPVGIKFGTVGVLDRGGTLHEVTTFRRDVRTDGRHAEVAFGVSLDDDLARRDLTINAIAYSASRDEVRDPFDGQRDLRRRLIRAVGDPETRMREDRLRALRALRFAARFEFEIDPATLAAVAHSAPHLGQLSAERVKQELDKTMEQVRCPSRALRLWRDTGALATLIPALAQLPEDGLRVPDSLALPSLSSRPQRRLLRITGLLVRLSPAEVKDLLTRLRYPKHEVQWASLVVERWQGAEDAIERLMFLDSASSSSSGRGAVPDRARPMLERCLVAMIGRLQIGPVLRLASAVWAVQRAEGADVPAPESLRSLHHRLLRIAFRDPVELDDLAIDGDDLRRSGISPGPNLGKILQSLLQSVLEDPERNKTDWLLQEALRLNVAGQSPGL